MLPLVLVLVAPFVGEILANETEVNVAGCKTTYTLGYGYKTMYHIRDASEHNDSQVTFRFYVKAQSDAHILFSPNEYPTNDDPAYEIVIGAGRNTFSVIRSQLRKYTRAHIDSPSILSSEEFRGFWISVSSRGQVQVGKEKEKAPFLFWDDPHPFAIHYFAFCTWGAVVGQWAFSCPNEIQSEEVAANLTDIEKLRKHLFTHYDVYSRPVIQTTDITAVFFQLQNREVKLDEKRSKMSVIADVLLQWQDQKLQWDPALYGNISKLSAAYYEIWTPYLHLYNAIGPGTGFLGYDSMSVSPVGSVKWRTQMKVEAHCNLDLSEWPYDTQVCGLQLGFWTEQQYLKLEYANEPENDTQQTNSEWKVLSLHYENIHVKTPWVNLSDMPKEGAMVVRYVLKRHNSIYEAVFGVPLLVISITTLLQFWISPMNPNKLHVSCLNLIIMSIFAVCLGRKLPAPADHVPALVQTYSQGMVAITFSILVSVAVINIARSDHLNPIPLVIQKVIHVRYIQMVFLLSVTSDQVTSNYGRLEECGSGNDQHPENSNVIPDEKEIRQQWITLALLIDRISFFIYAIYLGTVFLTQV